LIQFCLDFQPIWWNYVKKPGFFLAPRFNAELPQNRFGIFQESSTNWAVASFWPQNRDR